VRTNATLSEIVFAPLDESSLTTLERWFEDKELRRRLGGMLPLFAWFERLHNQPARIAWMAYHLGEPVGLVELEIGPDRTAWLTFLVNPLLRDRGYGHRILGAALSRPELTSLNRIRAVIQADNVASLRCFYSVGFGAEWSEPDEEGFVTVVYNLPERRAA
jgi:RimJ/RimL family protein N-acetyltransferase